MSSSGPPSTYDKYPTAEMFGETFTVKVGRDPLAIDTFTLHKGVASFYSGYFTAALKDNFQEGKTGVVELPTEDVVTFRAFVRWLYTRQIESTMESDFMSEIELWVFANCHNMPMLENAVLDCIRKKLAYAEHAANEPEASQGILHWVQREHMEYLFAYSTEKSPIRMLFMTAYAKEYKAIREFDHFRVKYLAEMGEEILSILWLVDTKGWAFKSFGDIILCQYHTHPEGVKCME